jgi:hypothetical protein
LTRKYTNFIYPRMSEDFREFAGQNRTAVIEALYAWRVSYSSFRKDDQIFDLFSSASPLCKMALTQDYPYHAWAFELWDGMDNDEYFFSVCRELRLLT